MIVQLEEPPSIPKMVFDFVNEMQSMKSISFNGL